MAITKTYTLANDGGTNIFQGRSGPAFTELASGGYALAGEYSTTTVDGFAFQDGLNALFAGTVAGSDPSITELSNGNFLVSTVNGTAFQRTIFDDTGAVVSATANIRTAAVFGSEGLSGEVTALPNGGYVVAFQAEFPSDVDQWIDFRDSSNASLALVALEALPGLTSTQASVAVMDNGNVAVAWNRDDNQMEMSIFSETGTVVVPTVIFDTDGSTFADASVVATDEGFAVFYESDADTTGGSDIRMAAFEEDGTLIGFKNISNPGGTSSPLNDQKPAAVRLPDGEIAVSWEVGGDIQVRIVSQDPAGSGSPQFEVLGGQAGTDFLRGVDITQLTVGSNGRDRLELRVAGENVTDADGVSQALSIRQRQQGDDDGDSFVAGAYLADFVGGGGTDSVSYAEKDAAVTVNLASGASGGAANGDTYDSIEGLTGSNFGDSLTGDSGENLLKGAGGADTLFGGGGADTLLGASFAGDTGNNTLFGGAGNDTFFGSDFVDTFDGGTGMDVVTLSDSVDVTFDLRRDNITGAAASDVFISIEGVTTGSGNDTIEGDAEANRLDGGAGNDTVAGFNGNDTVYGGAGDDFVQSGSGNTGSGTDTVYGGDGEDRVVGDQGIDVLYGDAGNDLMLGGRGADTLYGGDGDDDVRGAGIGDGVNDQGDQMFGGAGADRIAGTDGADLLAGGTGDDRMAGGRGNDIYIVDSAGDVVTETLEFSAGGGIDTVRAFIDYVQPDRVELVRLGNLNGTGNLNATGNDAPGTLVGNAGNNNLIGRGGNDQLNGNGGDDRITGNTGRDTMVGGAGADTFIYSSISESRTGSAERDVINGFDRGQDRIDLSAMDASLFSSGDQAWEFIGRNQFDADGPSSAGQLRLQSLGGPNAVLVEGDLRGDGETDFQIIVLSTTVLDAADFIL